MDFFVVGDEKHNPAFLRDVAFQIESSFPNATRITPVICEIQALNEKVRVHLLLRWCLIKPPYKIGKFRVLHYEDLVADRVNAFISRTLHTDAVDMYFILQHTPLEEALLFALKQSKLPLDIVAINSAIKRVEEFPQKIENWDVEFTKNITAQEIKDQLAQLKPKLQNMIKKLNNLWHSEQQNQR